ncbi:MAG TPA: phospho-N-acetylmuramoyl-pentapeptide-transferase [Candidatus Saccharimonadales bacterium]|nr:phospho-N-acetylmuramoyl-pentapeptide-transferase [Candidatus Saccharimonadales bacterium]
MVDLLAVLLFTFGTTFLLAVPFINLLYKLKFQRQRESQRDIFGAVTSIVNRLHGWKVGTPNAGGILIIVVTIVLSAVFYKIVPGYNIFSKLYGTNWIAAILYIALLSFGLLGLYDDVRKFYGFSMAGAWGLRIRYKFFLQWLLALLLAVLLYDKLHLSSVYLPVIGKSFELGWLYIPFAAGVIVATTNAVNITDGLDGLVPGLMIIALLAFWYLVSIANFPDVSLFISVTLGSLLAFMYFNIYPARVWLGDTGALALGAMLATIALITNSALVLLIIGFVFVVETGSVLIQWTSKALRDGKKVFLASPIHHHFEAKGWDETKVTMRFWLLGAISAFIGIFVALLRL